MPIADFLHVSFCSVISRNQHAVTLPAEEKQKKKKKFKIFGGKGKKTGAQKAAANWSLLLSGHDVD